jgi:hypothetical protein
MALHMVPQRVTTGLVLVLPSCNHAWVYRYNMLGAGGVGPN